MKTVKTPYQKHIDHELMLMGYGLQYINEPSYKFNIGDEVICGRLNHPIVKDILMDGKIYVLEYQAEVKDKFGRRTDKTETAYHVCKWTDCRPLSTLPTRFRKPSPVSAHYQNKTIDSLIHDYYAFGIDTDPPYQRAYVWSEDDKIRLIESIFMDAEIGRFVLVNKDLPPDKPTYEILDGKQRLLTIISFYENRLQYKNFSYNELSYADKNAFLEHRISVAIINGNEYDQNAIIEQFIRCNQSGKAMSKGDIDKAIQLMNQSKEDKP